MTRRAPSWLTEAIAWCASLVLLSAVAVVASGAIARHQPPPLTRIVQEPAVVLQVPAAQRAQAVSRRRSGGASFTPALLPNLGPPPGPVHDIAPTVIAAPEDRWALLVGITHYAPPTHDTLAGANDVAFIRAFLINSGWLPDHIHVLTDDQATGAAMRSELGWLVSKSTPGTFTFLHYSGHVRIMSGHVYLWPFDYDLIEDTELAGIIHRGTGKAWVDIAGCESAGFMQDLPSSRVLVSTSSRITQKSYEHPYWHESVWVGLVWDAGMTQGEADADHNGVVTVGEALRFAAYWAQAVTYTQTPYGMQSPQFAGMGVLGWTLADPPA